MRTHIDVSPVIDCTPETGLETIYAESCRLACHGESLGGNDEAPPLAGADFLSNWNDLTVGDLFERIRTTMPLNKPQSLSRETNVSILAHLLRVNKFPPGEAGLPVQTEAMKQIRIDAVKSGKER
jgi:S-disulfanyl-L-cysteine oxidoreductase SoxD